MSQRATQAAMRTSDAPSERHDLYELCCQRPGVLASALAVIHGGSPRVLHEDFCGTAALSRAWVADGEDRSALGVDIDAEVIEEAHRRAAGCRGLTLMREDVRSLTVKPGCADILFAGNFSIGELHTRRELVAYLKAARGRLRADGMIALDVFGTTPSGGVASRVRVFTRDDGTVVRSAWEQREYDPWTGMIRCAIHFRVCRGREVMLDLPEAFVYHWRVWSVPELRDCLHESGFRDARVVDPLAPDLQPGGEEPAVCVTARTMRAHGDTHPR